MVEDKKPYDMKGTVSFCTLDIKIINKDDRDRKEKL